MGKFLRKKTALDYNDVNNATLDERHVREKRKSQYLFAGLVALITFLVYLACLQNEFVNWDDSTYVTENPFIRTLNLSFLKFAFSSFYASNWHPLTWISHALDYAIWGLNPLGHHLTNNILHAINAFVVVVLVAGIIQAAKERMPAKGASPFLDEQRVLIAGCVTGLLFGLHPLRVESVAWIAERKDLLCALFFLLSILMYAGNATIVKGEEDHKDSSARVYSKQYLFSFGFFVLALLSKPMAVTVPFVLLILDWYPFKRIRSLKTCRAALVHKLPFMTLSIISSIVTIQAQKTTGAIASMEAVPLSTRVLVAVHSLMTYVGKMILPLNLVPYYPYPQNVSALSAENLLSIFLVVVITVACVVVAKRQKIWLAVWGYYVLTLIPVLGIIQVGGQSMADRYTYLPSLGPFLIIGLVVAWISKKVNKLRKWGVTVKLVSISFAMFLIISTTYLTFKQIGIWKDSMTLWSYVITKEPVSVPIAYYNRGIIFSKMGSFHQAVEDFNNAIALRHSFADAYYNRGMVFYLMGRFDKAMADFQKACDFGDRDGCNKIW